MPGSGKAIENPDGSRERGEVRTSSAEMVWTPRGVFLLAVMLAVMAVLAVMAMMAVFAMAATGARATAGA